MFWEEGRVPETSEQIVQLTEFQNDTQDVPKFLVLKTVQLSSHH